MLARQVVEHVLRFDTNWQVNRSMKASTPENSVGRIAGRTVVGDLFKVLVSNIVTYTEALNLVDAVL